MIIEKIEIYSLPNKTKRWTNIDIIYHQFIEFSRLVMFEIEDLFEKFDLIFELPESPADRSALAFLNCKLNVQTYREYN